MKAIKLFLLLFLLQNIVFAQNYQAGKSYFGKNNFIEYIAGNSPFVVSAPHGGNLKPSTIPDRNCTDCTTVQDANTSELALAVSKSFYEQTGCYPHVIICHLHRIKLDANRDLPEAALGNPDAEQAWNEFQNYIDSAKAQINKQFGKGFYIDLHGHGHTIQRLELGYLLYEDELAFKDDVLNTTKYINFSSLKNLVTKNNQKLKHAELLHGAQALGTLLQKQGYPSVPSQQDPFPQASDPYFSGGYNVARHSSYKGGAIDGVQIESNFEGVRDNASNRKKFADSLCSTVSKYLISHYFDSKFSFCKQTDTQDNSFDYQGAVFPNPFENTLSFQNLPTKKVEIYDAFGILVNTFTIVNELQTLNTNELKNGIYVIKIGTFTKKFIKMD